MKSLFFEFIKYSFQEISGNTKPYMIIRDYRDKINKSVPIRGSDNALYCYSIWLRHLTTIYEEGINDHPNTILELGPGATLGCGIAALLTGANKLYTFDINAIRDIGQNVNILDQLLVFFKNKSDIPDIPANRIPLKTYEFPSNKLTDELLERLLDDKRVDKIREAIINMRNSEYNGDIKIDFVDPLNIMKASGKEHIDMIFSQSVLEHVENLEVIYNLLYSLLKKGGVMSSVIDFSCHGISRYWNLHWACPEALWTILKNRRDYLLSNRLPYSTHIKLIKRAGFRILGDNRALDYSGLGNDNFPANMGLSYDDVTTYASHIIAVK
jgi:hypothetical protein